MSRDRLPEPVRPELLRASRAEAALLRAGVVEAVDLDDPAQIGAWGACDLASMIEGCFHRGLDPDRLDPAERERWRDRLGESYLAPGFRDDSWMTRYLWLLDEAGARAGTLALPATTDGGLELGIWSLYVRPDRRRRGLASRALEVAYGAARGVGLRGVRLDTHWVWQRALRFYLARGFWVTSWKASIQLGRWADLPPWSIEIADERATFRVRRAGGWRPLLAARRGEPIEGAGDEGAADALSNARLFAGPTFAVALACRGWPLDPATQRDPLVLGVAAGLRDFEAVARRRGWDVRVP